MFAIIRYKKHSHTLTAPVTELRSKHILLMPKGCIKNGNGLLQKLNRKNLFHHHMVVI